MMMIGINKSHNSFLYCFASYSATLVEGWNNFRRTSLLNCRSLFLRIYMFIHVNIQTGGGFAEGLIAKSLLQKTENTPNLKS